jgi:hypothetical protein
MDPATADPAELSAAYIAFQSVAAGIIPVLLIAYAFQLGVTRIWEHEEPIYRAIFPYYVGSVAGLMIVGEITAVSALMQEADNAFCRIVPLAAIVVPMFYIALGVVAEAQEKRAGFDWVKDFAEWHERGRLLREARDTRRAQRRARRSGTKKWFAQRPIPKPSLADVLLGGVDPLPLTPGR